MEAFLLIMGVVMVIGVVGVTVLGVALAMLFTEYDLQTNGQPGSARPGPVTKT